MAFKGLAEADIDQIRKLLSQNVPQKDIAARFSISQTDVSRIKNNRTYPKYQQTYLGSLSSKTRETLENIAANKDLSFPSYLKLIIHDAIANTPEHLKRRPID